MDYTVPTTGYKPPPTANIGKGANLSNWDTSLQDLYKNIMTQKPESFNKSTTQSTTVAHGNASPSLEANIKDWITKQNQVSTQSAGAYTKQQNTFTDLINSLQEVSRAQGSRAASSAGTSALASGMSPYEARGASNSVWKDAISQLMSGVAGLRQGQGQVGIDASKAQGDLLTNYGNFMQGVIAPYQMGLAGTTSETTSTTDDPSKYWNVLSSIASQIGQQDYQKGTLANQIQQNQISANQALWQYMNTARGQDLNYAQGQDQLRSQQEIAKAQLDQAMQQAIATGNASQMKSLMDYQTAIEKQGLANKGSMDVANLQYALPDITQMITGLKNQIGSLIKPQTAATPAPVVQAPPTQGSYPTGSDSFGYSPSYDAQGQVSYSANPNPWAGLDSSPDVQSLISEMFGWDANGQ